VFVASIPLDVWSVGEFGSITAVVGALLVAVAGLAVLRRGRVRRPTVAHVCLVGFVAWGSLSLAWSLDPDATVQRALTYGQLLVFVALFWQLVQTEEDVERVASAYVVGALIAGVGTITSYMTGQAFRDAGRYALAGYDPNDLGVTLSLGIPLAWFLAARKRGATRVLSFAYLPIVLVATALTASRGAMFTAVAALSIIPLSLVGMRRGARAALIAMLAAGGAALVYFVPETSWERLLDAREQIAGGTMTHRTIIWGAGWDVFAGNWLIGVGAGAFSAAVEKTLNWSVAAHNTPLSVAAELGLVGFVLFAAPFAWIARKARGVERDVRLMTYVMLLTWTVGSASLTWEYRKATWFVVTLLIQVAFAASVRRRVSEATGALHAEHAVHGFNVAPR
jgi:O-antigen ligase